MTEHHPERDVPQVDFDVHTGDPLGHEDTRDTEEPDGDAATKTTNPNEITNSKKEQS